MSLRNNANYKKQVSRMFEMISWRAYTTYSNYSTIIDEIVINFVLLLYRTGIRRDHGMATYSRRHYMVNVDG